MNSNQKVVQSTALRLIEPGVFEKHLITHDIKNNDVVVKPYLGSICHADLRYYTGNRRKEALNNKLPMALLHEALAVVEVSYHSNFKKGDRVVIVPSIPGYKLNNKKKEECCANCKNNGYDNYCLNGKFLGSGYDGAAQSNLVISGENLVHIPEEVTDDIAILAELCSVSLFAINLINDNNNKLITNSSPKVAVFVDGPLRYLTASALHFIYQILKNNLQVFGAIPEKVNQFEDFATTFLVNNYDFSGNTGFNTIFECTGGRFSSNAINQAIDLIDSQGNLVLMGVSEDLVSINTRDILEKNIRIIGSSRRTVIEFEQLMTGFTNPEYQKILSKLIPNKHFEINNTMDLTEAMEVKAKDKGGEKAYLSFKWDNII